jgi:very-short-patch-repair endonuclease
MRFQGSNDYYTKAERRFIRLLQENHIPFRAKVKIKHREVDFLIGKWAIEIDGHRQDTVKNKVLLEAGYNLIHFKNEDINPSLVKEILCLQN